MTIKQDPRFAVLYCAMRPPFQPTVTGQAPWSRQFLMDLFDGEHTSSLRSWWSRVSIGLLRPRFDIHMFRVLGSDEPEHAILSHNRPAMIDAAKRTWDDINPDRYDGVVALMTPPPTNAAAAGRNAVLDPGGSIPHSQHEVGHMLGLEHVLDNVGSTHIYGSPYCVMSNQWTFSYNIPTIPSSANLQIPNPLFWNASPAPSAATMWRAFRGTTLFDNPTKVTRVRRGQSAFVKSWSGGLQTSELAHPVLIVCEESPGGPALLVEVRMPTSFDGPRMTRNVVVHSCKTRANPPDKHEVDPVWFEGALPLRPGATFGTSDGRWSIVLDRIVESSNEMRNVYRITVR